MTPHSLRFTATLLFSFHTTLFSVSASGPTSQASQTTTNDFTSSPPQRLTYKCNWASVGHNHTYDSYLSCLLYKGTTYMIGEEKSRYYSPLWPKLVETSMYTLRLSPVLNPARNSTLYSFYLQYFYGSHFKLNIAPRLILYPGLMTNFTLGCRALFHNGNNPANVIGNTNLWLSLIVRYQMHSWPYLLLRNHFHAPFIGLMFAPKYTQTYYDMAYIDDFGGNLVFTSFGRRWQFRNEFSVERNLWSLATIRLGLLVEREVTKVNLNEARSTDVSFILGFVRNINTIKTKLPNNNNFASPITF